MKFRRCWMTLAAFAAWIGISCALATAIAAPPAASPKILVVGDSISAGYGLPPDSGWVRLLRDRLRAERLDYSVVNASISGDTTSGGRSRLPELLRTVKPAIVVVELGGNDGLRGLPVSAAEKNLSEMIESSQAAGARVLLVGMQLPPNFGRTYTQQFSAMYANLARKYRTAVVPFFFEGFGERIEAFQPDRIHPTLETQPLLLENVWPQLKTLLIKRPA